MSNYKKKYAVLYLKLSCLILLLILFLKNVVDFAKSVFDRFDYFGNYILLGTFYFSVSYL